MIGILLISHGGMAEGMLSSVSMLYPELDQVDFLALEPGDNPDEFKVKIEDKIKELDRGEGVCILCDLFGGTPSNQALYTLGDKVSMAAGMNLPMLLTLLVVRENTDNHNEILDQLLSESKDSLINVNELLKQKGIIQ